MILANSNPATIMTDPAIRRPHLRRAARRRGAGGHHRAGAARRPAAHPRRADRPSTWPWPCSSGASLERFGVEMIGASAEAIRTAEDRERFKAAMTEIGLAVPESGFAHTLGRGHGGRRRASATRSSSGRSFILGGAGTGIADDRRRSWPGWPPRAWPPARSARSWSSGRSPAGRSTSSRSCATGPTTAWSSARSRTSTRWACTPATRSPWPRPRPCPTSSTRPCATTPSPASAGSAWRPAARTSSSPSTRAAGGRLVIEMNPRVSPVVGPGLEGDRVPDRQDRRPPGRRLHPGRDPQRHHRRHPGQLRADHRLRGDQDPPLGLREAPGRARRSSAPACSRSARSWPSAAPSPSRCRRRSARSSRAGSASTATRAKPAYDACDDDELVRPGRRAPPPSGSSSSRRPCGGASPSTRLAEATGVDPWFLDQIALIIDERGPPRAAWRAAGRACRPGPATGGGPSGSASPTPSWPTCWAGTDEADGRGRPAWPPGCGPPSRRSTPAGPSSRPTRRTTTPPTRTRTRWPSEHAARVIILGSGPNRIGQGIEFDYCCVHASMALRAAGYETVMVNCNPETVSTDYDTRDRLYFEPLTAEDVANVIDAEQRAGGPVVGVIVRPGRPDPAQAGRPAAARPGARHLARPPSTWPRTASGGTPCAAAWTSPSPPGARPSPSTRPWPSWPRVGYPVLVRPSYVLGGRAMEIVYDDDDLRRVMAELAGRSLGREGGVSAERPVLVDRFLEDAIEVDVDAVRDRTGEVLIGGGHGARRGGRGALGRLRLRAPAADPRRRPCWRQIERHTRAHRRGPRGAWACSTCSSPSRTGRSSSSRPTRGPAGPCRSWPRPPACPWPWWPPG